MFFKKKNKKNNTDTNIVGNCPKCNGKISEENEYWICENSRNNTCNFKIKNIYENEKIDSILLKNILNQPDSKDFLGCIKSKAETVKNYKKYLGSDNAYDTDMTCPKCKNDIYRVDDYIMKCVNDQCDFEIEPHYKGITFSNEEIEHIFYKGISREYTFNDGSKGRVLLKMDNERNITNEFLFVQDIRELNNDYLKTYGDSIDKKVLRNTRCGTYYCVDRLIETIK